MKPDTAALQELVPDAPPGLVAEHVQRLDDSYFERFDVAAIAAHIRVLAQLSPLLPVDAIVTARDDGQVECTVLGFDAPGAFSVITGILMSLGFTIASGEADTYGPPLQRQSHRPTKDGQRRRIVDFFVGRLQTDAQLDDWTAELRERLANTFGLIQRHGATGVQQAHERVNEWVTQRLEQIGPAKPRSPFATDIGFNELSPGKLRLRVESEDTPAFLYSLSAALALHDVSIRRVRIQTVAGRIHDELEVELPAGSPAGQWQEHIRTAVLLSKQFTFFLEAAADPYTALTRFDWLATQTAGETRRADWLAVLANPAAMRYLARLLGASDFLWDDFIRQRYDEVLTTIRSRLEGAVHEASLEAVLREMPAAGRRGALSAYRERQAFLIQLDGILDDAQDPLPLSRRLTTLAEELVVASVDLLRAELGERMGAPSERYGIFALGKFGGAALGYASDLELLLVHEGAEHSQYWARLLEDLQALFRGKQEGLFQLDLRLRPWGKNAELDTPLATFASYYGPGGEAHSLERIALTRLRGIGGDAAFREHVERLRDQFVYGQPWLNLEELAETRDRQFRQKQAGARNAKYSAGGLVDVEYGVQILQIRRGGDIPELRTPNVEQAIRELGAHQVIDPLAAPRLAEAYLFLRRLINALRMLRGVAEDLELPDSDSAEVRHLARRMGYHEPDWKAAADDLERDFATHTSLVRQFVRDYVGDVMLPGSRNIPVSA